MGYTTGIPTVSGRAKRVRSVKRGADGGDARGVVMTAVSYILRLVSIGF